MSVRTVPRTGLAFFRLERAGSGLCASKGSFKRTGMGGFATVAYAVQEGSICETRRCELIQKFEKDDELAN